MEQVVTAGGRETIRSRGTLDRDGRHVILAAHWVERIGDRVTNIAEHVVFLASRRIEDLNP